MPPDEVPAWGEGMGKGRGDDSVGEEHLGESRCTRTSLGAVQSVRGWLSDLGGGPAQLEHRARGERGRPVRQPPA